MLAWWLAVGCSCGDEGGHREPPSTASGSETAHTSSPTSTGHTGSAPSEPLSWLLLDSGYRHSCGLLSDLRLVCWGEREWIENIPPGPFAQLSLGEMTGCALTSDGAATCWCLGTNTDVCDAIPGAQSGFIAIQDGEYAACAERSDHTLRCWGVAPQLRGVPSVPVVDWSMGGNAGCAVLGDGSVTCWGATDVFEAPNAMTAPPNHLKYTRVAVGVTQACALDVDGWVHCWGRTQFGEPFPNPGSGPWVELEAFNAFVCGIDGSGRVECWHDLPGILDEWIVPDERFRQLSLGDWTACGVTLDGRGLCFPAPYEQAGDQQVPALEDLVLP